jgi:cell division protein ZapE
MASLLDIFEQKQQSGGLSPDADQRRAVEGLEALRQALETYDPSKKTGWLFKKPPVPPRGFYLYGGVGRGKSMVMDMFFAAAPVPKKRRVHFHAFMLEVHDFLHELRTTRKGEQDRIDGDLIAAADHIASQATLLCFDEFQVKDVADAMILGRLFTALLERGVVFVITTNIAPDDLYLDGLQRDRFLPFIALLKEKLNVLHFTGGTDYRLRRLRELKVYFWPHDRDAAQQLDDIFKAVAGSDDAGPRDIEVKGRKIHVPKAAGRVAALTFAELCESNKSALDYLEMVKHFSVFIVYNVPKLDDNRRDAATRFITFIDTVYDNHAHVAISAAAPPAELYHGEFHSKTFARTASRLVEMQSREYRETGK